MIRELLHLLFVLSGRTPLARPLMCEHCGRIRRSLSQGGLATYRRYGFDRCPRDMHAMRPVPHPSDTDLRTVRK